MRFHEGRGLVVAILLALIVCSPGPDVARWTEDVQAHDGSVFQLESRAERGKTGFPLEHRGPVHYVEYHHRASGAHWKTSFGYRPIIWDVAGGKDYVIVLTHDTASCVLFGYPKDSVLVFRWGPQGWEPTTLDGLPVEWMSFNVLRAMFDREDARKDARGHVTLDEKRERDPGLIRLSKWLAEWGQSRAKSKAAVEAGGIGYQLGISRPKLEGSHGTPRFDGGVPQ